MPVRPSRRGRRRVVTAIRDHIRTHHPELLDEVTDDQIVSWIETSPDDLGNANVAAPVADVFRGYEGCT